MGNDRYGEPVAIGPVRLNFVNLKEKEKPGPNSSNAYSVVGLLPKQLKGGALQLFTELQAAMCNVAQVESFDVLKNHIFLDKEGKWKDGDLPDNAKYDGNPGHLFFKTTNKQRRPALQDKTQGDVPVDVAEEQITEVFYNGCYAVLIVTPAFIAERARTTFFLEAVIKVADGERLAGGNNEAEVANIAQTLDYASLVGPVGTPNTNPVPAPAAPTNPAPVQAAPIDVTAPVQQAQTTPVSPAPQAAPVNTAPAQAPAASTSGGINSLLK